MTHQLLWPGQPVGSYRIEAYLMRGPFGELYRARHSSTQKQVALKVVDVPSGVRVGRDVWALGERAPMLSHPALLPVHEVQLDAVPPFVVMAIASGGFLDRRLQIAGLFRLTAPETLTILSQVGEALTYLHGQHIVHRGVQPAAVSLTLTGDVRLSGLDCSCGLAELPGAQRMPTAGYAAPEERQGEVSEQSDQYALGCLAYRLLTGEEPSEHMHRRLARCIGEQLIPAHAGRAVLRALADLPSSRFERLADFVAALSSGQP